MNILRVAVTVFSGIILFACISFGQLPPQARDDRLTPTQREDAVIAVQSRELRELSRQTERGTSMTDFLSRGMEMRLRENTLIVPKEYYDKFSVSLKDKKTNLARLINNNCNSGKTISVQEIERCSDAPKFWGGGSYYSFRNKTNFNTDTGVWSDIQSTDNKFIAGSKTVQGIISEIGEKSFDDINFNSPELKFLIDYKPEKKSAGIQSQKRFLASGITSNGFIYSTSAPIKLNSTYVLRSIAYRLKDEKLMVDNRINMLVIFKVIALEKDGSVILLWKELKKDKAPTLES